jgi:tetratricopeptide (TPR) repeat protein
MTDNTTLISEWLEHPYRLSGTEKQQVADLLEKYPYLSSARLMQAAGEYEKDGFSAELLHDSRFFRGNWMKFYNMMSDAASERQAPVQKEADRDVEIKSTEEAGMSKAEETLIQPLFTDNYFQHQGINVPDAIPAELDKAQEPEEKDEKSLLVMMGFEEWLMFLKKKNDAKRSEEEDKAALRSMWQREKLAAAIGEEDDNIPEAVFEMAISSIDREEIMVSESLAEIHVKQGRLDKAIEIYRKLSLQNPEKKTYFAAKINHLNKENLS